MLEANIEKFIVNGCKEEVRIYANTNSRSNTTGYAKDQWTYMVEIMIITIKCLIPRDASHGSVIDYDRFNEELNLWYYYRHGDNQSLLASILKKEAHYWEYCDDSIYSRIPPIVFANEDWKLVKNQVLKNILYTTGRISSLIEGLVLAKLLSVLVSTPNIKVDDLINEMKEEIMCFSQKEFIENFTEYFKHPLNKYKGNYTIDFERKRIEVLNVLNRIYDKTEYKILKAALSFLCESKSEGYDSNFFISGLIGLRSNISDSTSIKDEEFIRNLCGFLVKLRKGRITGESLYIDKYVLPDIFQYKEGDVFFHSLLKKSQVIRRINDGNSIICFIRTRSGIYRFVKHLNT